MEKGYFVAAWGDVTKSPGWALILLRLGLLCLVPVFGIVRGVRVSLLVGS